MLCSIATYIGKTLSTFLVVLLTVSLFWCQDTECSGEGKAADSTEMICSVLDHQDDPAHSANDAHHDCGCVCHLPALVTQHTFYDSPYSITQFSVFLQPHLISISGNTLYRPPIA